MKKFIAFVLVMMMAVSMVACGGKTADKAPLEGTMEENVMKVMEIAPVEFMGGIIPVDLTDTSEDGLWALRSFTGLQDAASITDVALTPNAVSTIFLVEMLAEFTQPSPTSLQQSTLHLASRQSRNTVSTRLP